MGRQNTAMEEGKGQSKQYKFHQEKTHPVDLIWGTTNRQKLKSNVLETCTWVSKNQLLSLKSCSWERIFL